MTFRPLGSQFQVRIKNLQVTRINMFITVKKLFFYCDKHIYANYLCIFNLHLTMTSGRSKRRGFLSL